MAKKESVEKPDRLVLTREELRRVGELLLVLDRRRDEILDPNRTEIVPLVVDVKVVMVGKVCVTEPAHPILRRGRDACFYNATQCRVRLDFSGPGAAELASPRLELEAGEHRCVHVSSTNAGVGRVDLRRTIWCRCPGSETWKKCSGSGNGPEMEIDDPPRP